MDPVARPEELLNIIIRFTTSIPDLPLTISPSTTTALGLKLLIREHLPNEQRKSRLRLIHSGKVLDGSAALSALLGLKSTGKHSQDVKGKGKGKARATEPLDPIARPSIYIHCAIGDPLTAKELDEEAEAAHAADETLLQSPQRKASVGAASGAASSAEQANAGASSGTRAPRGFDRLLSSGFTAQEVASLRTQFLSILSYTHTPDSLPTGEALVNLEDRWLDSDNSNTLLSSGAETTGANNSGQAFGTDEQGLDDIFFGVIMGFFWPLGCLVWGIREEGIWTMRRRMAVFMGVVVGIGFGFVRMTG